MSSGIGAESEQMDQTGQGATYPRLVQVKQQYDPTNLFRLNQNIKPDTTARA